MRRHLIGVLIVGLVMGLLAAGMDAVARTGAIYGVVRDATGAVLPGVSVRLTRPPLPERTTVTDARGEFSFHGVTPGRYVLVASLPSSKPQNRAATVSAGGTVRVDVVLLTAVDRQERKSRAQSPALPPPAERSEEGVSASGQVAPLLAPAASAMSSRMNGAPAPVFNRRFNTETYDRIADNEWHDPRRDPLSTFSADVDTASYSNVRRFLNQGQMPPADAVRIEELINYFTFDYAEPPADKPFSVTTTLGECPWNQTHRLALIGLQARRIDAAHIPPRNLVFLIDVSGSMMEPRKLPLVKASLAMLAPNLTRRDRVAIVVYAGNTGLVLPSTPGNDTSTILDALGRLEAGGSTNGAAGLQLAYQVAQAQFIAGGVNRVILATDGDFNVGVTSQGALLRLIEEKRAGGVALSVLGYGMGNVKDATMVKLADAGNGNYAYIDSLAEAQKVLVEQAGGTLVTVAKDVKLQVEFNPRVVGSYRLIGYEKRLLAAQDFNNDAKDAGEIGAGHSVTVLYELAPLGESKNGLTIDPLKYQNQSAAAAAARAEAMTVKIRYKAPDGDVSKLMTVAVADHTAVMTPQLGFAAAVAEFGMLLRHSESKGSSSFADAQALAMRFKETDPYGHRAEFIRLIGAAEGLVNLNAAR